jgi:hypothetical protein
MKTIVPKLDLSSNSIIVEINGNINEFSFLSIKEATTFANLFGLLMNKTLSKKRLEKLIKDTK